MIIDSIKKRKGDLIVTFEDETTMQVEYDIYVKYHLAPSLAMDEKTFKEMQDENAFLFFKKKALKRLAQMMTAYELYTYLIDKGALEGIAKQIVFDFKEKKYLNDDAYVTWYIASKKLREGPRLLIDKLKQKGVDIELINRYVSQIDEANCLDVSLKKKLKGSIQQNRHQLTTKLKRYYMQKGFSFDIVSMCVKQAVSKLDINEQDLLEKDLAKLLRQSHQVFDKQKTIEKLYRKGYLIDDIKQALEAIDI